MIIHRGKMFEFEYFFEWWNVVLITCMLLLMRFHGVCDFQLRVIGKMWFGMMLCEFTIYKWRQEGNPIWMWMQLQTSMDAYYHAPPLLLLETSLNSYLLQQTLKLLPSDPGSTLARRNENGASSPQIPLTFHLPNMTDSNRCLVTTNIAKKKFQESRMNKNGRLSKLLQPWILNSSQDLLMHSKYNLKSNDGQVNTCQIPTQI